MITARMITDKYTELVPGYPYEVVKYEDGKIKLKDIPRIYPASDFKIQKDGTGAALNVKELQRGMLFEQIVLFLECMGISMLFIAAGVAVFIIFCIFYYWYGLIFEPWMYNVCGPWIVEQIKVIFRHPENFCFVLFLTVMLAGVACMLYIVVSEAWEKRKKR